MIPNRFVIFWNNQPTGVNDQGYPFKTSHPNKIVYWEQKEDAERFIDITYKRNSFIGFTGCVREIQFRILEN